MEASEPKQRGIAALATAVVDVFRGKNDSHDIDWVNAASRVRKRPRCSYTGDGAKSPPSVASSMQ